MAKLKYIGGSKRRVEWNSMGKAFSYTLVPNRVINIPDDQALIAMNFAPFVRVDDPKVAVEKKAKKVVAEKKLDPVAPPEPVVVEEPVVEPVVEEVVEDTVEVGEVVDDTNEWETAEEDDIDFVSMTKQEICDWLAENGYGDVDKSDHRKDTLVAMAVEHYNSL